MKTIASFDLGTNNMAFVCMNGSSILDVRLNNVSVNVDDVIKYLNSIEILKNCDIFLIERQMIINRKTFALQNQIEMYLKLHFKEKQVIILSSSLKTKMFSDSKMNYAQKKKFTINLAEQLNFPFPENGKKDDVADAFCQIIAYKKKYSIE